MDNLLAVFKKACITCLTLNGSFFFIAYALLVLFVGLAYSRKWSVSTGSSQLLPDLAKFNIPTVSIQTMILQAISGILTPDNFVQILSKFTNFVDKITGISKRSFVRNLLWILLFYYLIVFAPAALMIPTNYESEYTLQSIYALILMMLTNAIADYFSIKITLSNIRRTVEYYKDRLMSPESTSNFKQSLQTEALLYGTTLLDMLLAMLILTFVLILTSIYFGLSVGEYPLQFTEEFFQGAWHRVTVFIETAKEPYWFRKDIPVEGAVGVPMLLIYSVTTFVPTMIIFAFALLWTLLMPLRIVYQSSIN